MPSNPLLSIVVPTHNRSQYAESCIEAILSIDSPDIEVVVTDTSTDQILYQILNLERGDLLGDRRLVYRKIDYPSNLTKNNNDAVALATGEYVCLIGDDDCITELAVDAARWASRNKVDVVSQTVSSNYAWPDFRSRLAGAGHAGKLYVPRRIERPKRRNAAQDLQLGLARAFQGTDGMPRCYHGIVRRDILEQICKSSGAYFLGSSPDMSGAVSIACLVDEYYEVDLPLTIPGASAGSNSGRSAMNTHKGSLSSESQTNAFQHSEWSDGVPRFFSVENVWAHAGLQSLSTLRPDLVSSFNYARLLALCGIRHPEYAAFTNTAEEEVKLMMPEQAGSISSKINHEKRKERLGRISYYLKRGLIPTASGSRRHFQNLPNIAQALNKLNRYMAGWDVNFSDHMVSAHHN